jgi:hypothetical protein
MKRSMLSGAFLFMASLVSAGPVEGVSQLLEGLLDIIVLLIGFIADTIWEIDSFDEFLFAKLLIFTIVLLVVYTVIKKSSMFGDSKPIHWIITSAIAILSIRFMPDGFVQAILLQYGTLGTAIAIFVPFLIFFLFVHQSDIGSFGRKTGWVFYTASFIAIWAFEYADISEVNWLYGIGLTLIAISFLFDKYIHAQFGLSEYRKIRRDIVSENATRARRQLLQLEKDRTDRIISEKDYKRKLKHLEKIIARAGGAGSSAD